MVKVKARQGALSIQGFPYWEEMVVSNSKIYFKHQASSEHKPLRKFENEIFRGQSIIPPT